MLYCILYTEVREGSYLPHASVIRSSAPTSNTQRLRRGWCVDGVNRVGQGGESRLWTPCSRSSTHETWEVSWGGESVTSASGLSQQRLLVDRCLIVISHLVYLLKTVKVQKGTCGNNNNLYPPPPPPPFVFTL